MMIHEITEKAGQYKKRKRIGRGHGSGTGKQAGRGHKGAGSRRGHSTRFQFEGGQMPYFRRMPRLGFSNVQFETKFWTVNLRDIARADAFKNGGEVTPESLVAAKLIRDNSRDVKILGSVDDAGFKVKLTVKVNRVTAGAKKYIEDAGGSVHETGTRRDRVRGIDRNSDDRTPKNLTKKLRRGESKKK